MCPPRLPEVLFAAPLLLMVTSGLLQSYHVPRLIIDAKHIPTLRLFCTGLFITMANYHYYHYYSS